MVFSPTLILYIVIAFSFIVTSVFMFLPKDDERVHIIFFWLGAALNLLVTFFNATSVQADMTDQVIVAWCGLLFTAVGVIVRMAKGKTSAIANVLIMVSTVYGVAGYFLMT